MKTTELNANRGWDRADLDLGKLAALAFSIKTGGWQEAHPVTYETLPDGKREIRWGHRRTLAASIAAMSNGVDTVEGMVEFIAAVATTTVSGTVCPVCGSEVNEDMESCPECNAELYAESEVEGEEAIFVGVPGDIKVVSTRNLIAKYNDIIHGVDVDVPAEEIAYIDELHSQLSLIQDGLGREDADIIGLSKAIQRAVTMGANPKAVSSLGLTDNEIQSYLAIAQLPEFIGEWVSDGSLALSIPRMIMQLKDPNQRAAVVALLFPDIRVASVETMVGRIREFKLIQPDMVSSPGNNNSRLAGAHSFGVMLENNPVEAWKRVASYSTVDVPDNIHEALPELACETCPLRGKMGELPRIDAPGNGYRCQKTTDAKWCIYHSEQVYADFKVRTKADVQYNDGTAYFSSFELAKESYTALAADTAPAPVEADTRPIDKQRKAIAAFMELQSTESGREHPLATTCEGCSYHLTESPVASAPDAPHCAWANGRHTIDQGFLVDEKGYSIPRCLQYAPLATFGAMIPDSDPGSVPEEVLDRLIDQLASDLARAGIPPLRRLTGVPFSSSERYGDWFANRLKENSVTKGQKATLVAWLSAELDLHEHKVAVLQLPAGRVGAFKLRPVKQD